MLIISTLQGGELVIEHDQRWRVKVDLSEESRTGACFTAFYAGASWRSGMWHCFPNPSLRRDAALQHCSFHTCWCPAMLLMPLHLPTCSDCEHEVLPLQSGHRLVLTYNLVWAGAGPPPMPPVPEGRRAALRGAMPMCCLKVCKGIHAHVCEMHVRT